MKYNENNLVVSSTITQLEDELQNLANEINGFKTSLKTKFDDLGIVANEDDSLLEAINKLKQLNNASSNYGDIYNGTVYDLENETINKNEIKAVVLVKPGQRIEFTIGHKSYIKPANQFTTGANQFITVDWGDGTATQGYNYFCHTYENMDVDSLKPYNNDYKQAVITIKPTCYLEEEDILMPWSISFVSACQYNVIGINVNFTGITSEYYVESYPTISIANYRNLRYYYTTNAYITYNGCMSCYRLEKIKANKLFIHDNSYNCFVDCWSLATIDADITVDKEYANTNRYSMFQDCYNLTNIRSLNLGTVTTEANYDKLFANCFKLKSVPGLIIDCAITRATTCEFFYNCMSLENPFIYLINTNMLKNAYRLFAGCHQIVETPEELDFSLVTNASAMFSRCINMKVAPKRLYLDSATNCSYMFEHCWLLEESPSILTTNINCNNVNYMFSQCYTLRNVNCDLLFPKAVNNCQYMFGHCYSLTSFNSNVMQLGNDDITTGYGEAARYIFPHSTKLKKLPAQEMSVRFIEFSSGYNNINPEEYPETITMGVKSGTWLYGLKTLSKVKKMPKVINVVGTTATISLFNGSTGITEINDLTINIDTATNISSMFQECRSLVSVSNLTINAPNATNISSLFRYCPNLKTISNVKINLKPDSDINMSTIFDGCRSLEYVPDLGFSYEDNVSNMASAFYNSGIREFVFEKPFSRLTSLNAIFQYCRWLDKLKINLKTDIDFTNWLVGTNLLRNIDINITNPNTSKSPFTSMPSSNMLTSFKLDCNNTVIGNNGAASFSTLLVLHSMELYNYASTGNLTFDGNYRLRKIIITFKSGVSTNIYLRNGRLSGQALNEFFENLPTVSGKTIFLKGQENIADCDQSIATNKGWIINTTT